MGRRWPCGFGVLCLLAELPFWLQEEITEDDIEDGFKNMFQQLAGEVGTAVPRQALGRPRQGPGVARGRDPWPSGCREQGLPKKGLLGTLVMSWGLSVPPTKKQMLQLSPAVPRVCWEQDFGEGEVSRGPGSCRHAGHVVAPCCAVKRAGMCGQKCGKERGEEQGAANAAAAAAAGHGNQRLRAQDHPEQSHREA